MPEAPSANSFMQSPRPTQPFKLNRLTLHKLVLLCFLFWKIAQGNLRAARLVLVIARGNPEPCFTSRRCLRSAPKTRDADAPLFQPRNPKFVPHRTDPEGNVIFDVDVAIENAEEGAKRAAFQLRIEFGPDTDPESFEAPGSGVRKVYSFRPDPSLEPVLSKSQKRKQRKLAKTKMLEEGIQTGSAAGVRPSSPLADCPRPRRYIVNSGASFHLVDPRTLTTKERNTIEDIEVTANG